MDKMPCSISDGPQEPDLVWVEDCPECGEEYEADSYCKPCHMKRARKELRAALIAVKPVQISDDVLKEFGLEESFEAEFMTKKQAE